MSSPDNRPPHQPLWQPGQGPATAFVARRDSAARLIGVVGVVVGIAGVGIGAWSLVANSKPSTVFESNDSPAVESYSDEEVLAAKRQICEASELVATAVQNSNVPTNENDDPALKNSNTALSQIAFLAGASYLQNRLDPATPVELRDMVEVQIERYMRAVVGGAGGGGATYETDVAEADVAAVEVKRLCQ